METNTQVNLQKKIIPNIFYLLARRPKARKLEENQKMKYMEWVLTTCGVAFRPKIIEERIYFFLLA